MTRHDDNEWRLRYLRILTGPTASDYNAREYLHAIEDLIEEGLIRGTPAHGPEGVIEAVNLVRGPDGLAVTTLKGRLFIEDQQAILDSRTFFGRLKSALPASSAILIALVSWSLGLMTPLIQDRFPKRIDHDIQPQTKANAPSKLTGQIPNKADQTTPPPTAVHPVPAKP